MNQLQKPEPAPLDTATGTAALHMASQNRIEAASPMQLIQAVLAGGITPQNVEVFHKLVAMQREMAAAEHEREFNIAFVALQYDLPVVQKTTPVESKGVFLYAYAKFEHIMIQVAPLLKKHGFVVSFSQDFIDNRIIIACTLTHTSGHARTNRFSVRAGSKPPNASDAQGDGSNSTYAKRRALSDALNIVTDDIDDDARNQGNGSTISIEQAHDFQQRLENVHGDKAGFLRMAGATSYISILAKDYARLNAALRKKESQVPV